MATSLPDRGKEKYIEGKVKKMDKLIKEITLAFKGVKETTIEADKLIINAKKDDVLDILNFFKERGYDHLSLISCVDWIESGQFELIYILSSYSEQNGKKHIILKTKIPRKNPKFKTVIQIFENAEPYEREIHELFGINFEGHPRLTHLFLERNYKIPPFRKDFNTREYVKEFFEKIPFVEDKK